MSRILLTVYLKTFNNENYLKNKSELGVIKIWRKKLLDTYQVKSYAKVGYSTVFMSDLVLYTLDL